MESLASQYYAQIGIGGLARPMVVGDRLWLFSQTPSGQHQTIVLNTPPVPIQKLHSTIRGYPTPQPIPPSATSTITSPTAILESARNNMLARNQPLNYGYSKSTPYFAKSAAHLKAPYEQQFMGSKYLPTNAEGPYVTSDKAISDYSTSAKLPYGRLPNRTNFGGNDPMITYLENMKYGPANSGYCLLPEHPGDDDAMAPSGLSELERMFGGIDQGTDSKSDHRSANGDDQSNEENGLGYESDIDCEHLDETWGSWCATDHTSNDSFAPQPISADVSGS